MCRGGVSSVHHEQKNKYSAILQASDVPEDKRLAAEKKYVELLEYAFGSSSRVRGAYCEYVAVCSLRAEMPWQGPASPEEIRAVNLWEKTAQEATRRVFDELQIADNDAAFELHVWNSQSSRGSL